MIAGRRGAGGAFTDIRQRVRVSQPRLSERGMPVIGLCRLCANGMMLRLLHQADVPIGPRQRAVLESVAAILV